MLDRGVDLVPILHVLPRSDDSCSLLYALQGISVCTIFKRKLHRQGGFSLIEAVTAMAVMTVGFAGLASGFVSNSQAYDRARENAFVIQTLRQMAESIRGTPFGEIPITWQGWQFQVAEIGATGTVKVFVDETDTSADAAMLDLPRDLDGDGSATTTNVTNKHLLLPIKITLSWTSRDGPETRALYTMLAQEAN
jgi:Tfp pilus assembly protein PilV